LGNKIVAACCFSIVIRGGHFPPKLFQLKLFYSYNEQKEKKNKEKCRLKVGKAFGDLFL
jgi:hypothetical protein